jgi:hypothetical protein
MGIGVQGIMKQLFTAYPNTQVSEQTVATYVRLLKDIPEDELQAIVDQAIATSKFLPTIAEIRDMRHGLQNFGQLTYVEAWDTVLMEIRRIGSYGSPHFDDPLTARVVKSMGWRELCISENPGIDRAQFRDMYNALLNRQERDQKLLPQAREYVEHKGLISMRQLLETMQGKTVKQ